MTDRERELCNGIIHTASVAAAGVGAGTCDAFEIFVKTRCSKYHNIFLNNEIYLYFIT